MKLAWGKRVSAEFRAEVIGICFECEMEPSHLMACMAFESGETFAPFIRNAAGSGAVGLIQFMPQTAMLLGTTTDRLAKISAVEQLHYVCLYFTPFSGRLRTIEDVYMAILWPAAVGGPPDRVLFDRSDPAHPKRYLQNAGLDWNKDGLITKREAAAGVIRKLEKGMRPENVWEDGETS